MNGVAKRLSREHNERAWLAWHIEALARQKKLPKLSELTGSNRAQRSIPARKRDWKSDFAAASAWVQSRAKR